LRPRHSISASCQMASRLCNDAEPRPAWPNLAADLEETVVLTDPYGPPSPSTGSRTGSNSDVFIALMPMASSVWRIDFERPSWNGCASEVSSDCRHSTFRFVRSVAHSFMHRSLRHDVGPVQPSMRPSEARYGDRQHSERKFSPPPNHAARLPALHAASASGPALDRHVESSTWQTRCSSIPHTRKKPGS
jgi:hypothetical protein